MPPPADEDGKLWVRTTALIQGDAHDLYARWHDLESVPEWQEEITQVRITGPKTSHWVMKTGQDTTVEWDAETLADEPGKRIAWKSTGGDVDQAGEVTFEEAPAGRGVLRHSVAGVPHGQKLPARGRRSSDAIRSRLSSRT